MYGGGDFVVDGCEGWGGAGWVQGGGGGIDAYEAYWGREMVRSGLVFWERIGVFTYTLLLQSLVGRVGFNLDASLMMS